MTENFSSSSPPATIITTISTTTNTIFSTNYAINASTSQPALQLEAGFSQNAKESLQSTSTAIALVASFFAPTAGLDMARGVALFQTASCRSRMDLRFQEKNKNLGDEQVGINNTLASYWRQEIKFPETLLPGVPIRVGQNGNDDGLEFVRSAVLSWFFLVIIFAILYCFAFKIKNYWYLRMNILDSAKNNARKSRCLGSYPSFVWAACFVFSFAISNWAFFSGVLISAASKQSHANNTSANFGVDVFVIPILPFIFFFAFLFYFVVFRLRREMTRSADDRALLIAPSSFRAVSSFEIQRQTLLMTPFSRFCLVGNFAWSWNNLLNQKADTATVGEVKKKKKKNAQHRQDENDDEGHLERILTAKYLYEILGDVLTSFKGPTREDEAKENDENANRDIKRKVVVSKLKSSESAKQQQSRRPSQTRRFVAIAPHYYFVASVLTTICCLVSGMAAQNDDYCNIALPVNIAVALVDSIFIVAATPFLVPVQSLISVVVEACLLVTGIIAITVHPDNAPQAVLIAESLVLFSVWICTIVRTAFICMRWYNSRGVLETVHEDDQKKFESKLSVTDAQERNLGDFEEEEELHELGHSLLMSPSNRGNRNQPQRSNNIKNSRVRRMAELDSDENHAEDEDEDEEEEEEEEDPNDLRFTIPLTAKRQLPHQQRQNGRDDANHNNHNDDDDVSSSSSRTSTPPRRRNSLQNNNSHQLSLAPRRRRLVQFVSDEKLDTQVHYYDRYEQDKFQEVEDEARKASSPALSHRRFSILDSLQTVKSSEI